MMGVPEQLEAPLLSPPLAHVVYSANGLRIGAAEFFHALGVATATHGLTVRSRHTSSIPFPLSVTADATAAPSHLVVGRLTPPVQ